MRERAEAPGSTTDAAEQPSAGGEPIGVVARRLGVAPTTLRSWSHRYGIGPDTHQAGRHRRYTEHDVADLQTMCRLVGQGMEAGAAAAVTRERRRRRAGAAPDAADTRPGPDDAGSPPAEGRGTPPPVRAMLRASRRLDADTLVTAIRGVVAQRQVVATWDELCRPVLIALDRRVARTGECVDAELVLAWAATTVFREVVAATPLRSVAPRVLLAGTDGEHHTLPLEALHAALAEVHLPARMIGASVPDSALADAVRRTRPAVTVLWAQTPHTARLPTLTQVGRSGGSTLAVGPGWQAVELPAHVDTASTLNAAVEQVVGATAR